MGGQAVVGRIAGIPIILDFSLIFLVLLWGLPYFTAGNGGAITVGLALILGLTLSILLHELGHAFAGRIFGVETSHIELNGLGGLCYWGSPLPSAALPRIIISAAGPFTNLGLYFLLEGAVLGLQELPDTVGVVGGLGRLQYVCKVLAYANFALFVFNLLPAHPLDGGKILAALLQIRFGSFLANRIVGMLGLLLAFVCLLGALGIGPLDYGPFMGVLAVLLFLSNAQALDGSGRPPWKRWN